MRNKHERKLSKYKTMDPQTAQQATEDILEAIHAEGVYITISCKEVLRTKIEEIVEAYANWRLVDVQ